MRILKRSKNKLLYGQWQNSLLNVTPGTQTISHRTGMPGVIVCGVGVAATRPRRAVTVKVKTAENFIFGASERTRRTRQLSRTCWRVN